MRDASPTYTPSMPGDARRAAEGEPRRRLPMPMYAVSAAREGAGLQGGHERLESPERHRDRGEAHQADRRARATRDRDRGEDDVSIGPCRRGRSFAVALSHRLEQRAHACLADLAQAQRDHQQRQEARQHEPDGDAPPPVELIGHVELARCAPWTEQEEQRRNTREAAFTSRGGRRRSASSEVGQSAADAAARPRCAPPAPQSRAPRRAPRTEATAVRRLRGDRSRTHARRTAAASREAPRRPGGRRTPRGPSTA